MSRVPRGALIALALSGLAAVFLGQWLLARPGLTPFPLIVWGLGLATLGWLSHVAERAWTRGFEIRVDVMPKAPALEAARVPLWWWGVIAFLLWSVYSEMRHRAQDEGHGDIVVLWLLSIGAVIIAAWWGAIGRPKLGSVCAWLIRRRVDVLTLFGLVMVAAPLRIIGLERFPRLIDADGMALALFARRAKDGELPNPFGTGYLSNPVLWAYPQSVGIAVFGQSLTGARIVSACFGVAAVLFIYLLARQLYGRSVALCAGVLLACFHGHIWISRTALNNVADPAFLAAVTFFLARSLYASGPSVPRWATLAGIALGLSQYGYFAGRAFPFVVLVSICFATLWPERVQPGLTRVRAARAGAWLTLGFIAGFLPLLAHYISFPADYRARLDAVSIFGGSWLESEQSRTGSSAIKLVGENVGRAALLPFDTAPLGYYRGDPPFIGWPYALLFAVGLIVLVRQMGRWASLSLLAQYGAIVVAVGLTIGYATSRYLVTAPLIALIAAIGIMSLARIGRELLGLPTRVVQAGIVVTLLVTAAWSVPYTFRAENELVVYGDGNSLIAGELGRELHDQLNVVTVYFRGGPRMFYGGFATLAYLAPDVMGIDLPANWTLSDISPLTGTTWFVVLPEHQAELDRIRELAPDGVERIVTWRDGTVLYTVYEVPRSGEARGSPSQGASARVDPPDRIHARVSRKSASGQITCRFEGVS